MLVSTITAADQLTSQAPLLVRLREQSVDRPCVLYESWHAAGENEMVLFLKPEVMILPEPCLAEVLDLTSEKARAFGLAVESIVYLGAEYLEKYAVIDEHYGVINRLARSARANLSEEARNRFKEVYGLEVDQADIVGGFEILERSPEFDAELLDRLWSAERSEKLAPGTYCRRVRLGEEELFLVNGFHPFQLLHFTAPGRAILVMVVRGDTSWRVARTSLVGATRPQDAQAGSLRALLLSRMAELGLAEISQAFNGVHLSAGPVEAVAELRRFVSDLSAQQGVLPLSAFSFGQRLIESFGEETAEFLVSNPTLEHGGRRASVFDWTEELDSGPALERLCSVASLKVPFER